MAQAYVGMFIIHTLLRLAERLGLPRSEALEAADLEESETQDLDALAPEEAELALWSYLVEHVDDRTLGLQVGSALQRGDFQALEYIMRTSATLGEAMLMLPHFVRLIRGYDFCEVVESDEGLQVISHRDYDLQSRAAVIAMEASTTMLIAAMRNATGSSWSPARVGFRHAAPADVTPYAVLSADVRFDQEHTCLWVSAQDAARPMLEADPVLHRLIVKSAARQLDDLPKSRPIIVRVRRVLVEMLPTEEPSLPTVAEKLGYGARVLQRRLQAEGTSFRALVEEAREEIAKHYLAETSMTAIDVAMILDYSDAPSFHRAFKRWTGLSPGQFRKQQRDPSRKPSH